MKSSHALIVAGLLGLPLLSTAQQQFANTITATDLEKHLRILAADDMEGRETGMAGQRKAADYIANQFAVEGLKPLVKETDGKLAYLQPFTLYKKNVGRFLCQRRRQTARLSERFSSQWTAVCTRGNQL